MSLHTARRSPSRWLVRHGALGALLLAQSPAIADSSTTTNELLEQIAQQHDVVTEPPSPRLGSYTQDVGAAIGEGLTRWLAGFDDLGGTLVRVGAQTLITISVVLLVAFFARWLWRRRRQLLGDKPEPDVSLSALPTANQPPGKDWAKQIEQELAAGRLAQALQALWWWLATHLAPLAEASWTSRELIAHGRRPDLLPQVRQLDRLIYGAALPQASEIRGLWQTLQEKLE